MSLRVVVALAVCVTAFALFSDAQEQKQQIKHAPAPVTSPASGKEMFVSYCASCHGTDGKGDGPAATALKNPPADLTTLAERNGGRYPEAKVSSILSGKASVAAHGTQEMPVWGPVFWRMSQGHAVEVQQRIVNLNDYIKSLQVR